MKSILLTGGQGFIGSNLLEILVESGFEIYVLMRQKKNVFSLLQNNGHIHPVYCDLRDIHALPQILNSVRLDIVIHLAWDGVSGDNRSDYEMQIRNIEFTIQLLNAVRKLECKRFIGIGSTAEWDAYTACVKDATSPNLVSIYGITKMSAHFISKTLCSAYGIEHVWGIIGNTYGVGDNSNNFVNYAIKLMLSCDEAKFTSGEQYYDFVYVTDVARALVCLVNHGKNLCCYYIGSGAPRRLKEYIYFIRNVFNPQKELHLGAVIYNGISADIDSFSIKKISNDTGFKPQISFEDGIEMIKNNLKSRSCYLHRGGM